MKFAVLISAATAAPTFDDIQSPLPVIIGGELAAKGNSENFGLDFNLPARERNFHFFSL